MKALTYEGWADAGYHVRRGEKATGRNGKGEATFTRAQVDDGEPVQSAAPDLMEDVEDL